MPKRPNPTIGMVGCPICGELGAVRKDRSERMYYVCHCGGPFPLHGAKGREYVLSKGTIWGPEGTAPDDAPEWIRRGLGYPPGTRSPNGRPRAPAPAPSPAPSPAPIPPDDLEPDDDDGRLVGGLFL